MLITSSITKRFGAVVALQDVSLRLEAGEIVGLIGPNGAGKTTLFNVIGGFVQPDAGEVFLGNVRLTGWSPWRVASRGVARTFQDLRLIRQLSVLDNVVLATRHQLGESWIRSLFSRRDVREAERQMLERGRELLSRLGIEVKWKDLARDLSYGQQKLVALAQCGASDASLMLLDEPAAGIAPDLMEKMHAFIRDLSQSGKTILIIEHNFDFLKELCARIIVMDVGKVVYEGSPENMRSNESVLRAFLG